MIYQVISPTKDRFLFVDVEWGLAVLSAWMWESPALPQGKTQPPEVSPACQNKKPGHDEEIGEEHHRATSDPDQQPTKKFWESHREENTKKEIAQQALRMNYTVFAQSDSIRWHRAGPPPQQIGLKVIFWDKKVKRFKWRTRMGHCG